MTHPPIFGIPSPFYARHSRSAMLRWWRHAGVTSLVLTACSQAYMQEQGLAADNPDRVVAAIGSPDSAQTVAQLRAVRAGFIVSSSMPGLLVIGPYALKDDAGVQVTLRVNFVGDTAIITGTATDALGQALGRTLAGSQGEARATNQRILYASEGRNRRTWAELERLGRALRVVPP